MKIYKIAQSFEMIPQDPNVQNDPNVQLQNLQNAQQAIQYFKDVTTATEQIMADLRALEETMGMGDIGLRSQILGMVKQAAASSPAFNLLAHMNLIASVDNLLDAGELNNIQNLILTNLNSISDQYQGMNQGMGIK